MRNKQNYYIGLIGEYITILFYRCLLYKFVGHRIKNKAGEIDLIFTKDNTIVFIEVKNHKYFEEGTISLKQIERIKKAAEVFLSNQEVYKNHEIRFDLCIIRPFKHPKVLYNITQ